MYVCFDDSVKSKRFGVIKKNGYDSTHLKSANVAVPPANEAKVIVPDTSASNAKKNVPVLQRQVLFMGSKAAMGGGTKSKSSTKINVVGRTSAMSTSKVKENIAAPRRQVLFMGSKPAARGSNSKSSANIDAVARNTNIICGEATPQRQILFRTKAQYVLYFSLCVCCGMLPITLPVCFACDRKQESDESSRNSGLESTRR